MQRFKLPKTPHLPFSQSISSDDWLTSEEQFFNKNIIVSEKKDGQSTSIYSDGFVHARSTEGRRHESQNWVRRLAGEIQWKIPSGYRICGENLFATHAIKYNCLESYFEVYAIFNEKNVCLSWDETEDICLQLELTTVPITESGLYESIFSEGWEEVWGKIKTSSEDEVEGFVLRNSDSFHYDNWHINSGKFVRENHIKTSDHWMHQKIVKNKLRFDKE